MKYCTKCVLPQTHETIQFDEEGVCNICRAAEKKHEQIDWVERGKMLDAIINKYRDIAMQKKMLITFANYDKYITVGIASHFEYPEEANKFALENNQDFILAIIPPKSRTSKEEFNAHNS